MRSTPACRACWGASSTFANGGDEHGILRPRAGASPDSLPALGETVWLVPGHCDPTVNLHDHYVVRARRAAARPRRGRLVGRRARLRRLNAAGAQAVVIATSAAHGTRTKPPGLPARGRDYHRRGIGPVPTQGSTAKRMSSEFILETRGLTKEFKGFVAVNKVNLKVRRGSIHALIGPNGAGKTTCFNLLTKFLTPTARHDPVRRRGHHAARSRRRSRAAA